jgi:hypothetical protein
MRKLIAILVLSLSFPALAQDPPADQPSPVEPTEPEPIPVEPVADPIAEPVAEPVATPAPVETAPSSTAIMLIEPPKREHIVLGVKVGGFVPSLFSELDPSFVIGLEVGMVLPPLKRALVLVLAVDYSQPPADGSEMDDRVNGTGYTWEITQRELTFGLLAMLRPRLFGEKVRPFVAAGPRLYLLETTARGASGGESFGEYTEQSTTVGGVLAAGVDIKLGPGALVGELELGFSDLDHISTGDANTAALEIRVGYRFWL